MRRILSKIILIICCICYANAQTQQGIVKTPTRRNVNGTITKGQYIANATVGILFANNNAKQSYVSGAGGAFSFSATSPYFVTSVTANKGTYTFLDADFSKKQRTYSLNTVEVLVDDPDVLAKVREEAVAHERNKIRKQIRAKEDEIDALKEANKITTAEYNKMLGELSEYRQSSEAIVQQIAEVYATTDFDKLDEFNQQLLEFVEEGDFARADSLLKTQGSKEDLFKKIKDTDEAIKITEEHTQKAKELNNKEKEALSQRLYSEHLMWLQKPMMQDSALYCLKMRADLDTTNVDAVWKYADLCYEQKKFSDVETYYLICLRFYTSKKDIQNIAAIQNNLGALYRDLHDYSSSEKYYRLALENREHLFSQNPDAYRADLAMTQNNLGALYSDLHDYSNSEKYYKLALENCEHLFSQNPDAYRADLASTQHNLGNLYGVLHDYSNSEKYYKLALPNYEQLFSQNPDAYRADLAGSQDNLGVLYRDLHDYSSSEKYHKLALENREQLFSQNPDAYRADLATTQNNLGILYYYLHDFSSSEKYYKLALENKEHLFSQYPDAYRADLGRTQYNLGILYYYLHDYTNSEKYYKLALENREHLFSQNPDAYRADLAGTYWNIMLLFSEMKNLEQYGLSLESALKLYKELYLSQPSIYINYVVELQNGKVWRLLVNGKVDEAMFLAKETYALDESNETSKQYLAECYNSKAYEYAKASDYVNAHKSIDKAISMLPDNANFYDSKGEILLMQGKNQEAHEMWKKVMELNPNFLDDYPDGTNLSNGLKKLGLIE